MFKRKGIGGLAAAKPAQTGGASLVNVDITYQGKSK